MPSTKRNSPSDMMTENTECNKMVKIEDTKEENSQSSRMEKLLSNLRLRRIIKENHGQTIKQFAFLFNDKYFHARNPEDFDKGSDTVDSLDYHNNDTCNVLISVGGSEVNENILYYDHSKWSLIFQSFLLVDCLR